MTTTDLRSGVVGELGAKSPVLVATMVNITLSGEQTVNGVAVVSDDNVLVNGQTDTTENGVYVVSTGAWTRAVWFNNQLNAVSGTLILTTSGTLNPNTLWEVEADTTPIVFGTTHITFNFFQKAGAGGNFLMVANDLSDVANPATSRINLGVEIDVDVQAYNANLQTIAALGSIANTLTLNGLASIDNITALAGLAGVADKLAYFTGVGALSLTSFTTFARSLLASSDSSTARNTLQVAPVATSEQNIVLAGASTVAHGLGRLPLFIQTYLICKSPDSGYSIGDSFPADQMAGQTASTIAYGCSIIPDAINLNIKMSDSVPRIIEKATGAAADIDITKWKYIFHVF